MESVLASLSLALASTLLKIWLGNRTPAEATNDLLTRLTAISPYPSTRKGATSTLVAVGDRIAQNLLSGLQVDGRALTPGEREAVLSALAKALEQARIQTDQRGTTPLPAGDLAQQVLEATPAGLEGDAAKAYPETVRDASRSLVEVAAQLPADAESGLEMLATQERQVVASAEQALAFVWRVDASSQIANASPEEASYEAGYRSGLQQYLNSLPAIGVPSHRGLRLTDAYVGLRATYSSGSSPIETVLAQSPRLFVYGAPGSGKTTLLHWYAVCAATETLPDELATVRGRVPFFVAARQFDQGEWPGLSYLEQLSSRYVPTPPPGAWTMSQFESGRALLLIDGLDEVTDSRRPGLIEWLRDVQQSYPSVRCVVTSRNGSSAGQLTSSEPGFETASLLPLDDRQIDTFIDRRYRAIRKLARASNLTDVEGLANRLKFTIRQSPRLQLLARTPLQCALLCALTLDRTGSLPIRVADRERAVAELLLTEPRRHGYSESGLSPLASGALLRDLGLWLLQRGEQRVPVEQADKRFEQTLHELPEADGLRSGRDVRRYLTESAGILQEHTDGYLAFLTEDLGASFAAQGALDEGEMWRLVEAADKPAWRSAVIIAAGMAQQRDAYELVMGLLRRGDADPGSRSALYALAAECLDQLPRRDQTLVEAVNERMATLVRPGDGQAAVTTT